MSFYKLRCSLKVQIEIFVLGFNIITFDDSNKQGMKKMSNLNYLSHSDN